MDLSKRKQALVEMAKTVPYSAEELKLLHSLVRSSCTYDLISPPKEEEVYQGVEDALRWNQNDGGIWVLDHNNKLNLMQYILVEFPKVFIFLTMVPLNQVSLYLWKPGIAPFAEWRTRIGK